MANTEPLAKSSGSSNLGEALGTDMPVFRAPKTRGELTQAQYQNRMQQAGAEVAAKKSEMDLQLQQAESKAQSSKEFAQTMHSQEEERARKLKENELPTFKPTQDDAVALGQLFSLIATTGMLLGSSGKMSSFNSMNAMTGMLEGFSKGRADLFKQQKDIYDKEFQKMKALREDIKNDFDRYKELLATDREAADNLKSVLIAKVGQNSVLGKQLELGNLKAAGDTLQGVEKTMAEADRQSFELKKLDKQHEYSKELKHLEHDLKQGAGTGFGKASAINERYQNTVLRSSAEAVRSLELIEQIGIETGQGGLGGVVGKGNISSELASNLARTLTDEEQMNYKTAFGGVALELAYVLNGGYKPNESTIHELQNIYSVTPQDTLGTAAYKFSDLAAKLKVALEQAPDYTPHQKSGRESILKSLDKYASPEEIYQRMYGIPPKTDSTVRKQEDTTKDAENLVEQYRTKK